MPREPWRDDPEYVSLWRAARQEPDAPEAHLVMADWLEERGHGHASWLARLHGLTGAAPVIDPTSGAVHAGEVPMGVQAWARLIAAEPSEDVLCIFKRDVRAYRHLHRYPGRCGWALGNGDWFSRTELGHLIAVPRLEAITCSLVKPPGWEWLTGKLPRLTHFEASGLLVGADDLARLSGLPLLRTLALGGAHLAELDAVPFLPRLRHLSVVGRYWYEPEQVTFFLPPEMESIHAHLNGLGDSSRLPALRSFTHPESGHQVRLSLEQAHGLARFPCLERIDVRCIGLEAATVEALAGLTRLRELTLRCPDGEAVPSLKALAKAPALESLHIQGAMTDRHLTEAAAIRGLRSLTLSGVTGAGRGLAAVAGMAALEVLYLNGGECAGKGPPLSLAALPRLEKLEVLLTMSPEAAARLKSACPPWVECQVPEPEQEEEG
jgi:uncharacterized protein (TIGR02996 family)